MIKKYLSRLYEYEIKLNFLTILALVFFWTYGYMGALSSTTWSSQVIISMLLISVLSYFLYFSNKKTFNDMTVIYIRLKLFNIRIFSTIVFFIVVFGYQYFNVSLDGDELYHAMSANIQSIGGLLLLSEKLPSFINEEPIKMLVWMVSLLVMAFFIAVSIFLNKIKSDFKYILFAIIIFCIFRLIIILGGVNSPHPPFRLFPLWISSAIFSPSNFAFRMPEMLALGVLGFSLYKLLSQKINMPILWVFVFTVITIPVLWHSSYIVEPSIWAALFATLWLTALVSDNLNKLSDFIWFSLIAVAILMRQSLLFLIIPMLFVFIYERKIQLLINWRETFFSLSPLLIMIPFILQSVIIGTPASDVIKGEIQLSVIQKLLFSISSGSFSNAIIDNLGIWSYFIVFAFIPPKNNRLKYFISVSLFAISAFIIFYSIRPVLWGIPRYQTEYALPLAILGLIRILLLISNLKTIKYFIAIPILIALLMHNIYMVHITHSLKTTTINGHKIIASHPIYDYEDAFKAVKETGMGGSLYLVGTSYGIMNEVLYGYNLSETKKHFNIFKQVNQQTDIPKAIISNHDIKIVLLSDCIGKELIIKELLNKGFILWRNFSRNNSTEVIVGLIRENSNLNREK